ncbi:MAG: hypothetical protein HOP13_00290 [Alphaproteobacteria bacterium]|nr:hypothetical protein [Alphaproteobacteria bacterium]
MSGEITIPRTKRSTQSLRFEQALRPAVAGVMPHLSDVDYSSIGDLVPWIAVIDPDRASLALKFTRAGAGIEKLVGHEAVGSDYLELVDPAIKGDAFDSTFVMLSRPCGLWQITPGQMADGSRVKVEYTGFPVFDEQRGRGQVIFLIVHSIADVGKAPGVLTVQHSTEWHWIERRHA